MSNDRLGNEGAGQSSLAPGVYQPGSGQQERDEKRHLSTETDASWYKWNRSPSPNSDAGMSGLSPTTELSSVDEVDRRAASAPETSNKAKLPIQDLAQGHGDYVILQREFASKRAGWSQLRINWFNSVWAWWSKVKPEMEGREGFARLDHDLRDLRDIADEFDGCDRKLDELDSALNLRSGLNVVSPPSTTVAPPVGKTITTPLAGSEDGGLDETKDIAAREDYKAQYYSHVATIRYLSDALINHGPTPDEGFSTSEGYYDDDDDDDQSYEEGDEYDEDRAYQTDVSSDAPDPYEHGTVHLQLRSELEHERREAAKYKILCILHNIQLEDGLDDDLGSQDDGAYQTLFDEIISGPARVDAMVAVGQGPHQRSSSIAPGATRSSRGFRTEEWAASLTIPAWRAEVQTPVSQTMIVPRITLNEGTDSPQLPSDIDNTDSGSLQAPSHERQHTRRKSTSAMYKRPGAAVLEHSNRTRSVSFSLETPTMMQCYSVTG